MQCPLVIRHSCAKISGTSCFLTPDCLMGWHLFGYWVSLLLPSVTVKEAHLLSDICVHRGDSLSAGNQVGDSVNCPYHGWLFGADGICTHIPARPHLRIPAKARIDAYPTLERYGWIWHFLGDLCSRLLARKAMGQ